ncbi:class I SAM-dependent methyltransferase [Pontibacter sp. H249]|uniref:class I SAM-dependent methyltransferase n=1 Tax=Pontibacter sp. H249 TaxID=3133420 RepID=UPI0030C36BD7
MKSIIKKIQNKYYNIPIYRPQKKSSPQKLINIVSAWEGLELIIEDILERFDIGRDRCIEFGVEFGYSSVAFSNYFKEVIGVDTFEGDIHTTHKGNHFEETRQALSAFNNITLVKSAYQDWIKQDNSKYDLAHVDIVHTYEHTFECGLWAAKHSKCTIFHDTESFVEVRKAVIDIAKATRKKVYNYPHCNGLGIIV